MGWKLDLRALWSAVGHGCETREPQQDSSPRRCQKHAQRCFRNSIFGTTKGIQGNTRHTRHTWQSHRCLDGPASTMEKPCGALWGMVAKHRIPSRIQAQGGARGLRKDALEIASSEPLNTSDTSEQVQGNTYTRLTRQSHRCLDEPDYKAKP